MVLSKNEANEFKRLSPHTNHWKNELITASDHLRVIRVTHYYCLNPVWRTASNEREKKVFSRICTDEDVLFLDLNDCRLSGIWDSNIDRVMTANLMNPELNFPLNEHSLRFRCCVLLRTAQHWTSSIQVAFVCNFPVSTNKYRDVSTFTWRIA